MSLHRRVAKLEDEYRKAEGGTSGPFPWFSPKIWIFFAIPPNRWDEIALTEQERRELDEYLARPPRPPQEDPMWVLERMEAKAAEYQARFAAG